MKAPILVGMMVLGFAMFALSFAWATMFPGTSNWTPEKENRATEIKGKLYSLASVVNAPNPRLHAGQDLGQLKAEYDQLKTQAEQLDAELKAAYTSPRTTSSILKWTGLSLAVIGLIGFYAVQQHN
jgi:hypothetical protein